MSSVTVQGPVEPGRSPRRVEIPSGGRGTFGTCACGQCDWDLVIAASPAPDFRGVVEVGTAVWWLTNVSDTEPMLVADADRPDEPTAVRPGERLPFGFDVAIAKPPRPWRAVSVTVFAATEKVSKPPTRQCPAIKRDDGPRLDPRARYFAVLAALCEPRMDRAVGEPAPTSADIATRLDISPRAVDAHIDYLVRKLGIPEPTNRRTGWKRSALINHVRSRGVGMDLHRRGRVGGPA